MYFLYIKHILAIIWLQIFIFIFYKKITNVFF